MRGILFIRFAERLPRAGVTSAVGGFNMAGEKEFAMSLPLRTGSDANRVRDAARRSKDAGQARRGLAPTASYEIASHTEAARRWDRRADCRRLGGEVHRGWK